MCSLDTYSPNLNFCTPSKIKALPANKDKYFPMRSCASSYALIGRRFARISHMEVGFIIVLKFSPNSTLILVGFDQGNYPLRN